MPTMECFNETQCPFELSFMNELNRLSGGRLVVERTRALEIYLSTLVWMESNPSAVEIIVDMSLISLFGVIIYFVRRYLWRSGQRKALERQVVDFRQEISNLQDKIVSLEALELMALESSKGDGGSKEVRIWLDGAFDMMHYGHMNAFRKGKVLGTHLIAGVNSDESIAECKGPPVLNMKERLAMVNAVKWVDEVVTDVPYVLTDKYLLEIIEKYDIDYLVHGDDPCIVDGKDVYERAKRMGKYRSIPRTDGVSTTDIVGRMLLLTRNHHTHDKASTSGLRKRNSTAGSLPHLASRDSLGHDDDTDSTDSFSDDDHSTVTTLQSSTDLISRRSHFLTTSHILTQFSAGVQAPAEGMRVVYIAGSWDMFHAGHVATLELARTQGDYLIVGVHSDSVVNDRKGSNLPIMSMQERVLSVSGCKHCDDVLLDAPYMITDEVIEHLRVDVVCHIRSSDSRNNTPTAASGSGGDREGKWDLVATSSWDKEIHGDPYVIPREAGKLKVLDAPTEFADLNVHGITARIQAQRQRYEEKITRKKKQEAAYYANKFRGNKTDTGK